MSLIGSTLLFAVFVMVGSTFALASNCSESTVATECITSSHVCAFCRDFLSCMPCREGEPIQCADLLLPNATSAKYICIAIADSNPSSPTLLGIIITAMVLSFLIMLLMGTLFLGYRLCCLADPRNTRRYVVAGPVVATSDNDDESNAHTHDRPLGICVCVWVLLCIGLSVPMGIAVSHGQPWPAELVRNVWNVVLMSGPVSIGMWILLKIIEYLHRCYSNGCGRNQDATVSV
jgi:hypothetical protein